MSDEVQTSFRQLGKVGRNDPCPCESGKKWKRCHGDPARVMTWSFNHPVLQQEWVTTATDREWATASFRRAWDDAVAAGSLPAGAAFADGLIR